jgi:5-methylphenazine-1-carboxylate 1-monooxygenase
MIAEDPPQTNIRGQSVRVLIAGAGIAGLTAALSLHAAGIDVLVTDSVRELKPLGVGINLLPHAVRELTELGLGDRLAEIGIETAEQAHFDTHGGFIWSEPRGRGLGYRWPQYSIHRGRLQMLLLEAVRARLGSDAVRTGTAVTGFTQGDGEVRVRLSSLRNGSSRLGSDDLPTADLHGADLLLGADGLYSSVRARLHPGEPAPRWSGVMMWRGIAEAEPFLTGASLAITGSTTAVKFVAYPVGRSGAGKALVNWVAEVMVGGDEPPVRPDWTREGRLAEVLPYFRDWRFGWLDVPALIAGTPEILQYPMVDRDPLPSWGTGPVTLAGDAAHPVYPIGSNGGSQAIIDARVLARELTVAGSVEEAVAAYEAARIPATSRIVLATRDMPVERVLDMVRHRAPHGFDRIEDVMSDGELAELREAYRSTSLQDVAALNDRPPLLP